MVSIFVEQLVSVSKAEGLDSTSDANSPDEGFHDTCKDSWNMSE